MMSTRLSTENSSCPLTLSLGQFISWPRPALNIRTRVSRVDGRDAGPLGPHFSHLFACTRQETSPNVKQTSTSLLLSHVERALLPFDNSGTRIRLPRVSAAFCIWLLKSHSLLLAKRENTLQDTHGRILLARPGRSQITSSHILLARDSHMACKGCWETI